MRTSRFHSAIGSPTIGRRRVLAGIAAASGAGAAFLAACGGGSSTSDSGGKQASPAATQAAAQAGAAPAGQPKRGGTLSLATQNRAPNRDVHLQTTALVQSSNVGPAYSRLLKFKVGQGIVGDSLPAPDLAEKWEQPDPQTLVFHLRPNAKFHPISPVDGRQVVANDVVYSFTRQMDLKVNSQYLGDISKMTAVDPQTLRIELKRPSSDAIVHLAVTWNKIIAHEVVEKFGDLKESPVVGSGPFIVDSIQSQSVELKRNPDYFLPGLPYIERLRYTQIDDRNTTLAAFRTGDVHTITVTKQELDLLQRQNSKIGVQRWPSTIAYGAMATTADPPSSDMRVRQAVSRAINRAAVLNTVWLGEAAITTSMSIDNSVELKKDELEKLLGFDKNAAGALLKEAGVTNWAPKMTVWNSPESQPGGELVGPMLQDAGIKASLELVDNARAVEIMTTGNGLVVHWGAWPSFPSVTFDLRFRWKTGGSWNGPKLSDPELDRMIDAQEIEQDRNKRTVMLQDIQRRILQTLSYMPVSRPTTITVSAPQLRNNVWVPYLSYDQLLEMWLDA
jgi:peptide/nickel transport system substrate-binding protein